MINTKFEQVILNVKPCYVKDGKVKTDKVKGCFVDFLEINPIDKSTVYTSKYIPEEVISYQQLSLFKPFDAVIVTARMSNINNPYLTIVSIEKNANPVNMLEIRY